MTTTATVPRLLTPKQFCEQFPYYTLHGFQWVLFNRQENGLAASGAVLKLGKRRLLIDVEKFHQWIENGNNNGKA
jgi:hypothetical protein